MQYGDVVCAMPGAQLRYGLADFDFGAFNATPFCGLEDCGPNAFCNSLLQVWAVESPWFGRWCASFTNSASPFRLTCTHPFPTALIKN
jgi:hypothetical protein